MKQINVEKRIEWWIRQKEKKAEKRKEIFPKTLKFHKAANAQLLTARYTHLYMIKDQGSQ